MIHKWDIRFFELAALVASWSKDPSTKVGCIITDSKRRILSLGYNGFPRGVDDTQERYENRQLKYQLIQHAEANAILNATCNLENSIAYVTHHPCASCAGLLIQAGVKTVKTYEPSDDLKSRFSESFELSKIMFEEANVKLFTF